MDDGECCQYPVLPMPIFNVGEGSVRSRAKQKFYNKLLDWKKRANKKPLFVRGARQIGISLIILVVDIGRESSFFGIIQA